MAGKSPPRDSASPYVVNPFIAPSSAMITLYDHSATELQDAAAGKVAWVNLVNPSHHELAEIEGRYEIPLDFLTAALDPEERARFEVDESVMLILIRIPIRSQQAEEGVPYITRPLGIIVSPHILLTICTRENSVLDDLLRSRRTPMNLKDRVQFVLNIFDRTTLKYQRFLKDLDLQSQEVEEHLRRNQRNEELLRLLSAEKSLVFFRTSLQTNQFMLERMRRTSLFRTAKDEQAELLDDIIIENAQAIEMANIFTNILNSLASAFSSI
ncbi:MAG: magnesium transporter CorA family protein, partial [Bacteroidetes bacterium]|nr:magnesium transporter CorA family protein [Bacteroidota bacterium]